jgi:hypothetical protein
MKDARGHGSNSNRGGGSFGIHGIGIATNAQFSNRQILSDRGKLLTPTDRVVTDVRSRLKDGGGIGHAFMSGIKRALGV